MHCNKMRRMRIYISVYTEKRKGGFIIDDAALVRALRRGKRAALEQVMTRYGAYVAAVVSAQLGQGALHEDVEELSADVFVSLWQSRQTLRTDHLRGYLGAVARNAARAFLRKSGPVVYSAEDYLLVQDEDAARLLERSEQRALIERLLGTLEPVDRELFLRRYYYGETTAAIASALAMNENTVRSRLLRGRNRLRAILEEGGYALASSNL